MMRRIPLWLTLVPLAVAIAVYWLLWSGWARDFKAEAARWVPGHTVSVSGFPYRIEVDIGAPQLSGGSVVSFTASAASALANRGPWQPDLTVIRMVAPKATVAVGGAAAQTAMRADVTAKTAIASVNVQNGKVARLSTVFEAAVGRIGAIAPPLAADTLEIHLREVPGRLPEPRSPTLPGRGQAVVAGERLRIGGGDALTLASDIAVTGRARLSDFARWADGGTIEVRTLTLADAHGEVARLSATLLPIGRSGLRMAGTIDTVCPEAVAAAFAGVAPAAAHRLRTPVRLAFEAVADGARTATLSGMPADIATRPRRAQMAGCPVIRGGAR